MRQVGWIRSCAATLLVLGCFVSVGAHAYDLSFPGGTLTLAGAKHGQDLAGPVRLILILTALSLAPALIVSVTSFTRIIVVLSMLRQAIGMPNTPPNPVLVSLAIFLTIFSMSPVLTKLNTTVLQPYLAGHLDDRDAAITAEVPIKQFMESQVHDSDLALMYRISQKPLPKSRADVGLMELVPAFMLSELKVAFEIGFVIFLPFVLIDMVVASVLMSLGMIMVPPLAISLPLKVMMFVLIDGWGLVTESLLRSFHG